MSEDDIPMEYDRDGDYVAPPVAQVRDFYRPAPSPVFQYPNPDEYYEQQYEYGDAHEFRD